MKKESSPSVLVVEDDPVNAFVMQKYLKDFPHHLAKNAEEALEYCSRNKYELILMDINLGDDGFEGIKIMQSLKDKQPGFPKKFIAVTSYAMAGDKDKFLNTGFDDYFAKPVDQTKLLRTIKSILQ